MSSMTGYGGVKLQLRSMNYEGLSEDVENASRAGGGYDTLFVSVCDESGLVLSSVKWNYDRNTSSLRLEGLHEGSYRLSVMGVRGDISRDGVRVNSLSRADEEWFSFPAKVAPLEAEYYYSSTPLEVTVSGGQEQVTTSEEIVQYPICSRLSFGFAFASTDVERMAVAR